MINILKDNSVHISENSTIDTNPNIKDDVLDVVEKLKHQTRRLNTQKMRKKSALLVFIFGGLYLVFALYFALKWLGWSNSAAFLGIAIAVFVLGLLITKEQ